MTCGSQPSSGNKEKKRKNRAGWAAGLLGPAAPTIHRTWRCGRRRLAGWAGFGRFGPAAETFFFLLFPFLFLFSFFLF
jgi:hypothetical protein